MKTQDELLHVWDAERATSAASPPEALFDALREEPRREARAVRRVFAVALALAMLLLVWLWRVDAEEGARRDAALLSVALSGRL